MDDMRNVVNPELLDLYRRWCRAGHDLSEHLGALYGLARASEHVTEFGNHLGVSTSALLLAQPRTLHLVDRIRWPSVDTVQRLATRTEVLFTLGDTRTIDPIPTTELLFIDTDHSAACLREELRRHSRSVTRWIALHDTVTFGAKYIDGTPGLNLAVEEFLEGQLGEPAGTWAEWAFWRHCHGLTVLHRVGH